MKLLRFDFTYKRNAPQKLSFFWILAYMSRIQLIQYYDNNKISHKLIITNLTLLKY